MGQADEDLMRARQRLAEDLEKAQTRATTRYVTGVLSLIAAALLGTIFTRSITHPLARLAQGARALAAGISDTGLQ